MLPAVSIVVPTRNRLALLPDAVGSVLGQTRDDWELIIVDDASEDGTPEWLGTLGDPRVRSIRLDVRAEKGRARNIGLGVARGRFTLFLDDDDLLVARAVETHLKALDAYPEAIASIGEFSAFGDRAVPRLCRAPRRVTVRYIWEDVLFGWMATFGQALCRTDPLRHAGGWDESYVKAVDHELWLRLARIGPVVLLPDVVLRYRIHSGQWIPQDFPRLMTEIREKAVARVAGRERETGDRILRARRLMRSAGEYERREERLNALRLYLAAIPAALRLLRSPLTRPMVLRPIVWCIAGGVRRLLLPGWRRSPTPASPNHEPVVMESDGRWPGGPGGKETPTSAFGEGRPGGGH